jgi:hypothetical protein
MLLVVAARERLVLESFSLARSNCSWVTMAGTVVIGIHSSGVTGATVLEGRPIGRVAERLIRGVRRERNAKPHIAPGCGDCADLFGLLSKRPFVR